MYDPNGGKSEGVITREDIVKLKNMLVDIRGGKKVKLNLMIPREGMTKDEADEHFLCHSRVFVVLKEPLITISLTPKEWYSKKSLKIFAMRLHNEINLHKPFIS